MITNANIYLVGYRATGKTSVGRLLAARLQRPFTDMDTELARRHNHTIPEIVEKYGWPVFRDFEKAILEDLAQRQGRVIATGGGVVLLPQNRHLLTRSGFCIWLRATPETIRTRLLADSTAVTARPGLTPQGTLHEIETVLAERIPLYHEVARAIIPVDDLTIDGVCERIARCST